MFISVIGGSECTEEEAKLAREVGRELAKRGATVVCGGLTGVMRAVCQGAKEAGGRTVGILPGNDPKEANPYVDIPIVTGMGYARNAIVVKSGRAVIAFAGNFGTLSEIGLALAEEIPVIGLRTWKLARDEKMDSSIILADSPVDAVDKAMTAAKTRESPTPS